MFVESVIATSGSTGALVKAGIAVATLAGGGVAAHEYSGDGNYTLADLTQEQINHLIDEDVLGCAVAPDIQAYLGDKAVEIIQVELNEEGYSRSGPDNILGPATCKDIFAIQLDNNLVIDGEVGYQTVGVFGEDFDLYDYSGDGGNDIITEQQQPLATYEVANIECRTMADLPASEGYSRSAVLTIQAALKQHGFGRGGEDGKFLELTCDELVAFQQANGLHVDGVVGPETAKVLGIDYEQIKNTVVANAQKFEPKTHCPNADACNIEVNLNTQRLIVTNDNGEELWNIPVQSGKRGYETRNVTYKLGAVEYGPNGNPERASIDYPEAILVNTRSTGGGSQKLHGSYAFNEWAIDDPDSGSAGCTRTEIEDSFVLAEMPTGTDIRIHGAKPGTAQK